MKNFDWLICPCCKDKIMHIESPDKKGPNEFQPGAANIMLCLVCGTPSLVILEDEKIFELGPEELLFLKDNNPDFFSTIMFEMLNRGERYRQHIERLNKNN